MAGLTLCCPKCHLVTDHLETHIVENCMKNNTDGEREVVILQAQDHMENQVETNVVVPYDQVETRFQRQGQRVVVEVTRYLEVLGHFVTGQPSEEPTPPVVTPVTSDVTGDGSSTTSCSRASLSSDSSPRSPSPPARDHADASRSSHDRRKQAQAVTSSSLPRTLSDCRSILRVANRHFLSALEDARDDSLNISSYLTILNCLTATLNMGHCQPRCVVEYLLVEEWLNGVSVELGNETCFVVNVTDFSGQPLPPAAFCLSAQEHEWFRIYFEKCRPFIIDFRKDSQTKYFFLSSTGKRIYNQSNDIRRFQQKYGVPHCNITDCRQAMQTSARRTLGYRHVRDCLSLVLRWDRCKTPANLARAQRILNTLGSDDGAQPSTSATGSQAAGDDVTPLASSQSSATRTSESEDSDEAPSKKRRTESHTVPKPKKTLRKRHPRAAKSLHL